jgi:hypothetical protein
MMNECSFHFYMQQSQSMFADLSDVTIYFGDAFVFEYITLFFLELNAHLAVFSVFRRE